MPLTKCSSGGKSGWKWGNSGHCYTGPNAKQQAIKQGYAENKGDESSFKKEMSKSEHWSNPDVQTIVAYLLTGNDNPANKFLDAIDFELEYEETYAYISKEERDKVSTEDFGDPKNRKYPVRDQKDLDSAAKLVGRAPAQQQTAIRSRLKAIAKRKGLKVPESWGK